MNHNKAFGIKKRGLITKIFFHVSSEKLTYRILLDDEGTNCYLMGICVTMFCKRIELQKVSLLMFMYTICCCLPEQTTALLLSKKLQNSLYMSSFSSQSSDPLYSLLCESISSSSPDCFYLCNSGHYITTPSCTFSPRNLFRNFCASSLFSASIPDRLNTLTKTVYSTEHESVKVK